MNWTNKYKHQKLHLKHFHFMYLKQESWLCAQIDHTDIVFAVLMLYEDTNCLIRKNMDPHNISINA